MRETLFDFLKSQKGYYIEGICLRRPGHDNTIAAEYNKDRGKWETIPTQEEMVLYEQMCGRGIPSSGMGDLTNTQTPSKRRTPLNELLK